jgi:hypothetical protein
VHFPIYLVLSESMKTTSTPRVKKWRNKSKKNHKYNAIYMRKMRKHYRMLYLTGQIAFDNIPVSYRYFTDQPHKIKKL